MVPLLAVALTALLGACTGVIEDPGVSGPSGAGDDNRGVSGSAGWADGSGGASTAGADGPDNPHGAFDPDNPQGAFDPDNPLAAAPPVFNCDDSREPVELPLPRLSREQLQRTLEFAIRQALPAEADEIWNATRGKFTEYPVDQRTAAPGDLKGGYSRFDQSIQQSQIEATYWTGIAIAEQLTATPARLESMMGTCATDESDANDRSCLEAFIGTWAARVMRAELSPEDVAYYADIAEDTPVGADSVADVIATILNAPETLYRVEHGTEDDEARSSLSAFELAERLSYNLWQEPPDDELWAKAADGSLLETSVYEAEVDRVLRSPKLRNSIDEWVREWLRLEELPPLDTLDDDPAFAAFAGADLPTSETRQALIDDVLDSAWNAVTTGDSASAWLGDPHSYARDPWLADVYGVPPWDGASSPPLIPSPNRSGLLTRAAFLATGTTGTRPIHKGYLVRNALLCQRVGAPPPSANTEVPVANERVTTRDAVTERTSAGVCAGCHTEIINPPGFITEGFDALGRERTEERLFDAQGHLIASLPVDTSAVPAVQAGDDRVMSSAPELGQAIATSGLFHSCLARHYFRFAAARVESPERDGCLLSKLEAELRSDAPLFDLLKAVALDRSFKTKRFE